MFRGWPGSHWHTAHHGLVTSSSRNVTKGCLLFKMSSLSACVSHWAFCRGWCPCFPLRMWIGELKTGLCVLVNEQNPEIFLDMFYWTFWRQCGSAVHSVGTEELWRPWTSNFIFMLFWLHISRDNDLWPLVAALEVTMTMATHGISHGSRQGTREAGLLFWSFRPFCNTAFLKEVLF